jgi:hypothetical protein
VKGPTAPKPVRFEQFRWLGDKRNQTVHDMDNPRAACRVDEVAASGLATSFGPDILPEARNRGYHACRHCGGAP